MLYLASPFGHPDPIVRHTRYELVLEAAATLIKRGMLVYSPIVHNYHLLKFDLPPGFDFWRAFDLQILPRCEKLGVLKIDGWDKSVGVKEEISEAKRLGIPVMYLTRAEPHDWGDYE